MNALILVDVNAHQLLSRCIYPPVMTCLVSSDFANCKTVSLDFAWPFWWWRLVLIAPWFFFQKRLQHSEEDGHVSSCRLPKSQFWKISILDNTVYMMNTEKFCKVMLVISLNISFYRIWNSENDLLICNHHICMFQNVTMY